MTERLSAAMRDRLDALVAVGDDDPHSPLHRIKTGSSSPSVGGMKRLLARLELLEATGALEIDVDWVNGNYQRILFHTVRTASADRVREMAAPRRHLALGCFLQPSVARHARPGRRHGTASSSTGTASWSRPASTTCSRRSAKPSTGSSTRRSAASFMARSAWTYWWVVAVSSWPSQRAMTVMSTPDWSRCIAIVWRSVWGEIRLKRLRAVRAGLDPEETCAGKARGAACWQEITGQPGCYIWNPGLQPGSSVSLEREVR